MNKSYLLASFVVLMFFNEGLAQKNSCPQVQSCDSIEQVNCRQMSQSKMQEIIDKEVALFTDYVSQSFEYPKSAEYKMLEGEMRVRVIYDNGFDQIAITQSIDPKIDDMVLQHIEEYIANFERDYSDAPRLVFDLPITFRMTNW